MNELMNHQLLSKFSGRKSVGIRVVPGEKDKTPYAIYYYYW